MSSLSDPIVVEQEYGVSAEELWRAITERDQMVLWFFDNIPEFRPEEGFTTEFNVSTGERDELRAASTLHSTTSPWV